GAPGAVRCARIEATDEAWVRDIVLKPSINDNSFTRPEMPSRTPALSSADVPSPPSFGPNRCLLGPGRPPLPRLRPDHDRSRRNPPIDRQLPPRHRGSHRAPPRWKRLVSHPFERPDRPAPA